MTVVIKRVYEPVSRQDGARVLVDRLWPRGVSKANAHIDEWLRDLAPSDSLRRTFHAQLQQAGASPAQISPAQINDVQTSPMRAAKSSSRRLRRNQGQPHAWAAFRAKYLKELTHPEGETALRQLYQLADKKKRVTLLYASKNEIYNNAVVLKELLDGRRKPPTGTGPGAIAAPGKRKAAAK